MTTYLARVRVVGTGWVGAPGLWTFYFRGNTSGDIPLDNDDCQNSLDRVRAAVTDAGWLWPTAMTFNFSPQVDNIEVETGELHNQEIVTAGAAKNGLSSDTFGPIPVGVLLQLGTAGVVHNRRVQGRSFFAPMVKQADTDGTPRDADRALAVAFGDALLDEGVSGPLASVWSRPVKVGTATVPVRDGSAHLVTSVSCPNKFAVMRSRRD